MTRGLGKKKKTRNRGSQQMDLWSRRISWQEKKVLLLPDQHADFQVRKGRLNSNFSGVERRSEFLLPLHPYIHNDGQEVSTSRICSMVSIDSTAILAPSQLPKHRHHWHSRYRQDISRQPPRKFMAYGQLQQCDCF